MQAHYIAKRAHYKIGAAIAATALVVGAGLAAAPAVTNDAGNSLRKHYSVTQVERPDGNSLSSADGNSL